MHSPIGATALLEPVPRSPIHPKAAARFPAAFRALFRFPTRTVRKPQEVVILVTIMACLMVETDDRQWARHIRDHRNGENGKKSRRPYAPGRSVARRLHPTPSLTPRRAPAHGCATTRENVMADESLRRHSLADARESFDVTEQHGHHGLRGEQNRALTGIRRSISLFCTISVASTSRR
jgi:hypothetical protein